MIPDHLVKILDKQKANDFYYCYFLLAKAFHSNLRGLLYFSWELTTMTEVGTRDIQQLGWDVLVTPDVKREE